MQADDLAVRGHYRTPAGFESIRLLHVLPTLEIGGLERIAASLALNFRDRVARVAVCSPSASPFEDVLREAGIDVHLIPPPAPRAGALARAGLGVARVIARERPHIVHAHNPAAAIAAHLGRTLAQGRRPALVATYQGVVDDRLRQATVALSLSADLVVGCGRGATRELIAHGLPPARAVTVANAVSPAPGRASDDVRREFDVGSSDLVVTVGRYVHQKNQELLLAAIARLVRRRPSVRALVVGGGALEPELRRRVGTLGLDGVVTITGERADAVDLIAAADVYVLSSRWEGYPVTLVEAMALGRPVVATAVRGVTDTVRHEATGLLVPPDDPEALAAAIERVLAEDGLKGALGENARALARRVFSAETMLERYAIVYAAALERRGRTPARLAA